MDRAQDQAAKNIFEYLMNEESKHKTLFADMLGNLGDIQLPAWSDTEEYQRYITDLINTHILLGGKWGDSLQDKLETDEDALRFAMKFERDTILFFTEMEKMVPDNEKEHVQACVNEERSHLRKLAAML
ncbi:ferritin-like domain-containing protein [Salidesulfovibrio brasiliensis]|uniref:ferritin-like domain-containing protein n=1 Tax=Salidesulfovibrio brasiliensis TaxID=221711 RepID=UPI0009FA1889|nr:ferritin family protein [Salidesulfovibrio brasiliensis]